MICIIIVKNDFKCAVNKCIAAHSMWIPGGLHTELLGLHLESTGNHLESTWNPQGMSGNPPGIHLECTWNEWESTWNGPGMDLEWTGNPPAIHREFTWNGPGMIPYTPELDQFFSSLNSYWWSPVGIQWESTGVQWDYFYTNRTPLGFQVIPVVPLDSSGNRGASVKY